MLTARSESSKQLPSIRGTGEKLAQHTSESYHWLTLNAGSSSGVSSGSWCRTWAAISLGSRSVMTSLSAPSTTEPVWNTVWLVSMSDRWQMSRPVVQSTDPTLTRPSCKYADVNKTKRWSAETGETSGGDSLMAMQKVMGCDFRTIFCTFTTIPITMTMINHNENYDSNDINVNQSINGKSLINDIKERSSQGRQIHSPIWQPV